MSVEVESVLADLQERKLLGPTRIDGENRTFSCPKSENHGGRTWQKTPSFGVHMETGQFNCFACHFSGPNIWVLWQALTGESPELGRDALGVAPPTPAEEIERSLALLEKPKALVECRTIWPRGVPINESPEATQYLLGRGIQKEMWEFLRLSWYAEQYMPELPSEKRVRGRRIIIPIQVAGKTLGYSSRSVDKDNDPKYFRPVTGIGSLLYDPFSRLSDKSITTIYLTEGEISEWAAEREGLPTVASFGSNLSEGQAMLLTRFKQVITLYDDDEAGTTGAAKAVVAYQGRVNLRPFWLPKGQDPASLKPGWGKVVAGMAEKPVKTVDDLDRLVLK